MSTEGSAGKRVGSNAGKAAIAAGAFALGAGATAGASALIDGHAIKRGSIPANRLTKSAQRQLKGARGPRGAKGANGSAGAAGKAGATGPAGTTGATGPFGPQLLSAAIVTLAGTEYISPATGAVSPTESDVQVPAPSAMTARSLAVALSSAVGAGATVTVTLRDNGADTALTCGITGAATTCSDPSDSVAVAAGDELSLGVTTVRSLGKCVTACSETAGISLRLS